MRKKVLIPLFNRAHYGRLRSVLEAVKKHPELELQLMVGIPAAYDHFLTNIKNSRPHSWISALPWYFRARLLSIIDFFKPGTILKNDFLARGILNDGYAINSRVSLFLDGGTSETMAKSVGLGIMGIVDELKRLKPDVVFVNADRFEMMAVALAASYLNIPIAHNEGGDISGTLDESVRHAITKLSHVHFTATEASRRRVLQMGEDPKLVFTVGSPPIDTIKQLDLKLPKDFASGLDADKPFLLVLLHPVATESKESNAQMAREVLGAIDALGMPTLLLGSNIDAGSDEVGKIVRQWRDSKKLSNVFFTKHLQPNDFYRALANAACAIGNSSSFIREGAYFGTPAVVVGSRQQNRDRGKNVKDAETEAGEIKKAIQYQIKHGRYPSDKLFGSGNTGPAIADVLAKVSPRIQKEFHEV